jgi:hypothetical protein
MTIENLRLVRGHPMLLDTAMDAVREWRCQPLVLNDEPAEVKTQATVRFPLAAWDGPWHNALLLRDQGAWRHTGVGYRATLGGTAVTWGDEAGPL